MRTPPPAHKIVFIKEERAAQVRAAVGEMMKWTKKYNVRDVTLG